MKTTMLSLSQQRFSVRNFTSQPVSDEVLQYIVEVGRLSPSAVNYQPWYIVVVRNQELLAKLVEQVYPREWFASAPCCMVVCGNHHASWHRASDGKDHCDIDIAIATQQMVMAATEQGLGSCWVCNFDVEACKSLLQLPEGVEPMVLLPLGYPATDTPPEKKRKPIEEIVSWR